MFVDQVERAIIRGIGVLIDLRRETGLQGEADR